MFPIFKTLRSSMATPLCAVLAALLLSFMAPASAWAASAFNLLDARERGVVTRSGFADRATSPHSRVNWQDVFGTRA